jgi:AraC family transcriptional regulator
MLLFHAPGLLRIIEMRYDAGLRIRAHTHPLPSMSIVLDGMLHERRGRIVESARPLSLSFMGADLAHDDEFGPRGGVLFQVHFESPNDTLDDCGALLDGWHWFRGGPAVRPFLRLVNAARRRSGEDIEQIVLDVVAAPEHAPFARGAPPRWLRRVREAIDETREWPRVGELANIAGVHRVQLARQFRRYFGCSVSAYVRRSRVQLAAERIVAGGNIAAASHDAGFHDHAHLCHAFETETSLSPSGWRSFSSDALGGKRPRARAQRAVV